MTTMDSKTVTMGGVALVFIFVVVRVGIGSQSNYDSSSMMQRKHSSAQAPYPMNRMRDKAKPVKHVKSISEIGFEEELKIEEDSPIVVAAGPPPPPAPAPYSPPPPTIKAISYKGRSPNSYIDKHITDKLRSYWEELSEKRAQNEKEINEKYGRLCLQNTGIHCWSQAIDGNAVKQYSPVDTCECKGHKNDNKTNWVVARREFCKGLDDELQKKFPMPTDLKAPLFLNFDTLQPNGVLPHKFADPFPSGKAVGEIPYNINTVRNHFLRLRAGLVYFYHGEENLDQGFTPKPDTPQYLNTMKLLGDKIAASLVHGGNLVFATMGDSTVAGQDNCVWDAWPYGLERQFQPLFAAAKVNFTVRNVGKNGGWKMSEQLICAPAYTGYDVDVIIKSTPFVKATPYHDLFFARAALQSGIVPIMMEKTSVPESDFTDLSVPVFFGQHNLVHDWIPKNTGDRNHDHWGAIGDGLCHVISTRSGSAPVHNRNWHPGPMGHQVLQDIIAFLLADAVIYALNEIQMVFDKSHGAIEPLKIKWPKNRKVEPLPSIKNSELCKVKDARESVRVSRDRLCGSESSPPIGIFPVCATQVLPVYGTLISDWVVDDGPWKATKNKWETVRSSPTPFSSCGGNCNLQNSPKVFETIRKGVCTGEDFDYGYDSTTADDDAWLTIKFKGGTLPRGSISVCGVCKNETHQQIPPTFRIKGNGIDSVFENITWGVDYFGNGLEKSNFERKCGTIVTELDRNALDEDVYLGIQCKTAGRIRQIIAF